MSRTTFTAVLGLGLALSLASPAPAGWWDEAGGAKETTLAELRRDPEPWRDVTVALSARFVRVPERVNPFFTQFNPASWQPVAVRTDGAVKGRPAVFERVFVKRGSEQERLLGKLSADEPLLLRGVVRDTVGGEPWIEVLRITRSGDALTPEEDARVRQADRFLAKSNPVAAEKLYRGVLDARELADAERGRLRAKLGAALYAQGRLEDARTELVAALAIDPLDRASADRLERVTAALAAPKSALPPTARIGRPAPELPPAPSEALTLPGNRQPLAPPSGLDGKTAPASSRTPSSQPTLEELSQPAPAPEKLPRPVVPTPVPPKDEAAQRLPTPPKRGPAPAKLEKPLPKPVPPKPAPPTPQVEDEEEEVPPLPARPPLVGPK